MNNIKLKTAFTVSSWFETFFALQVLTDPDSRIHQEWKATTLQTIPASFHKKFSLIGGSPYLWPMIADTLLDSSLSLSFDEMLSRFAALPASTLQHTIFVGLFHDNAAVKKLLSGHADLYQTITRISKTKREWLAFVGLYPPKKKSPFFKGLESLIRVPSEFQRIVTDLLEIFWTQEFRQTWERIVPKLEKSREEKERLFHSCSLEEFARIALLRIEIDKRENALKAVRGGYSLPLHRIARLLIFPSAFNDRRHWTTFEADPRNVVAFFPYFDPAISLSRFSTTGGASEEPEIDPALVFKALGDTTRYAMVLLIAKEPMTSSDLARTLELSRPTVSHHIHILREAGLLNEKTQGNTLLLTLKREVIENLSDLAIRKLFGPGETIDLKKTRTR